MKKSLIALAVAGVVAAPAAFAATGNVDVYGKLRVSLSSIDGDWELGDQVSRIGFKGTEDLGGGLKAVWQIESGVGGNGMTGGVGTASIASRNTFVGLAGGFGTVVMGRHDTPYKMAGSADLFGDTLADAQNNGGIIGAGNFDLRVDRALAYISPDFSGFHVAAAVVPGIAGDNELTDAYSVAAMYKNGPLNASLGYEDHNNLADEDAWKVNVGYAMGDLKLGATYESQEYAGNDNDNWLVSAAYGMGPITLAAQYGDTETNDFKQWTLGMIYAMSKRTSAALAYSNIDFDGGDDIDAFTVQLNHDF
ncbi:MAG: porin [Pseudomonadota bacterium]